MTRGEKANQYHNSGFNCAQGVFTACCDLTGLDEKTALSIAASFGGGMRCGSVCGAVTGALMVLGMLGYDEKQATALLRKVREGHGALDCATLLRTSHEAGIPRKQHCDGIVFELLQGVEDIVNG